jgi:hypothetical protein
MAQASVRLQIVNQQPVARLTEAELLVTLVERVKTANRRGSARTMCILFNEGIQTEAAYPQYRAHYNSLHTWIQEFEHDFVAALRRDLKKWAKDHPHVKTEDVFLRKFYEPLNGCQTFLQAINVYDRIRQEHDELGSPGPSRQQLFCYNLLADFFGEYNFCLNVNEEERLAEERRLEAEQHRLATASINTGFAMLVRMHGRRMAANIAASFLLAYITGSPNAAVSAVESSLRTIIEVSSGPASPLPQRAALGTAAEE